MIELLLLKNTDTRTFTSSSLIWICYHVDKLGWENLKSPWSYWRGIIDAQHKLGYVLSLILFNHRLLRDDKIWIISLSCLGTALPLEIYFKLPWCFIHSNILCSATRHTCQASRIWGPCAIALCFLLLVLIFNQAQQFVRLHKNYLLF